ncbi:CpsD/CapB family tyrosine-protein kinase [Turicibacter sanguinis]|uniref:CpsD/CapB family tyrosine-protein kinase n=1 Tax=Turicibacter sanguinis TaxID=154288 RepID=UPI0018AA48B7|nr:CpsD/CapB family tyrosine-protein kinase [Turicibacter sanguinis]MDB8558389.1 CpsD/CapB family tyrosine-protein kinase [Turicibacter sanguinis]MDB8561185.1 CpsD/CapB family tyrosine-protein kinase [Turicibacter sanguinis]
MKKSKKLEQQYQQVSECYRTLRTNLQYSVLDQEHKVFLFTSHELNNKMTSTIGHLGLMFAKIGKRVLIIEADLYRPRLHRFFNVNKEPGMSNVLLKENTTKEAIIEIEHNLHLLPSGRLVSNPHLVIESVKLNRLLSQLKLNYDVILITSPPMCFVNDATLLSTQVSGVLFLIDEGKSKIKKVKQCQKQLNQVNAHVIGAIMTNSTRNSAYYYDYV